MLSLDAVYSHGVVLMAIDATFMKRGFKQQIGASAWGDGIAWGRSSERAPTFWVDPHHIVKVTDPVEDYDFNNLLTDEAKNENAEKQQEVNATTTFGCG